MFVFFKFLIFLFVLSADFFILHINLSNSWLIVIYMFLYLYEGVFARLDNITEIYKLIKANILAFLISLLIAVFMDKDIKDILLFFVLNFVFSPLLVYVAKKIFVQKFPIKLLRKRVVALFDEEGEDNIKSWFSKDNVFGYDIEKIELNKISKENLQQVSDFLDNHSFDAVILSFKNASILKLVYLIDKFQVKVRKILIFPNINLPFYNLKTMSSFSAKNIIFSITNNLFIQSNIILKAIMDFIISTVLIVLFFPVFVFVYCVILFVDKTNPIYKQLRIGKNGKLFYLYKFKTMKDMPFEEFENFLKNNNDAAEEWEKYKKLKNDPRVTKIGRFLRTTSLDELPQLFNVVKGDMALIGPRPYLPEEKEEMGEFFEYYKKVKPGITGLWQVSGRNELTFKERILLDTWYIKNWSIEMDNMILLKTIYIVLTKKGSY